MRETWQTRLAAFAKRHPALKAPVFALLWAGFRLSAAAEACGRKWSDSWDAGPAPKGGHYSWRLRVLSLSMALLVGFAALPAARYYADEAEVPQTVQQDDGTEMPDAAGDAEETGDDTAGGDGADLTDGAELDETDGTDTEAPGGGETDEGAGDPAAPGGDKDPAGGGEAEGPSEDAARTVITGFAGLDEALLLQAYPVGTPLEKLALPESLEVTLEVVPAAGGAAAAALEAGLLAADEAALQMIESEEAGPEEALLPAEDMTAQAEGDAFQAIPVGWLAQPAYDELLAAAYLFTPVLPEGLALAEGVELPAITVVLGEEEMSVQALGDIYVNGDIGSDSNAGSEQDPVLTLAGAISKVGATGKIYVMTDLTGQGNAGTLASKTVTITSVGGPFTIKREDSANGVFLQMDVMSKLTLSDITLDGNAVAASANSQSLILVAEGCTLTLGDKAVLQNNRSMDGGGAINVSGSTVVMENGSVIQNNRSDGDGGAIAAPAQAVITMEDGSLIEANTATGNGGGVLLNVGSELKLTGGVISGNSAAGDGKDVYVQGELMSGILDLPAFLTITRGVIGSTDADAGGGLYVADYTGNTKDPATQVRIASDFVVADTTIYVDKDFEAQGDQGTFGARVADTSAYTSGNKYLAAARFISPSSSMAVGTVDSKGYVTLVPPSPVMVHYNLYSASSPGLYVPTYCINLAEAVKESAKATNSGNKTAYITLRTNLAGITSAPTRQTLRAKETVLRSETGTYSFAYNGVQSLFDVADGNVLTFENVTMDNDASVLTAVTVSGGAFTLASTGTIDAQQTGVSVTSGSFALSGTVTGGAGVTVSGTGTMSMAGGRIEDATGTAVQLSGTAAGTGFVMSGGTITGAGDRGVQVDGSRTFKMTGGTITKSISSGVQMNANSTAVFNMSGGSIEENTGAPGVYVAGGTAVLSGGFITGNGSTGGNSSGGIGVGVWQSGGTLAISGDVTISDSTFAGVHLSGGDLEISGDAVISGSTFAGVYLAGGTLTMSGGTITGSGALNSTGSGIYAHGGTLALAGGTIEKNMAANGAGLYVDSGFGSLTMTGGTISENIATVNGGGIYLGKAVTLAGGTIGKNTAAAGGGIYSAASTGTLTLGAVTIGGASSETAGNGNEAANGGGVYMAGGAALALQSTGLTIGYNIATVNGGGIYVDAGSLAMSGGTIKNNEAVAGAGLYLDDDLTSAALSGGTITGNAATDGGGIYTLGAATLDGVLVKTNTATNAGGGLHAGAAVTLGEGSGFDDNTAKAGMGGAIYLDGGNLLLAGGRVGDELRANGVGRAGSEQIELVTGFVTADIQVMLERVEKYVARDVIYNGDTIDGDDPDWLFFNTSDFNKTKVGGSFWTVGKDAADEDQLLWGVWVSGSPDGQIVFQPAGVRIEYPAADPQDPPEIEYASDLPGAFTAVANKAVLGGTQLVAEIYVGEDTTVTAGMTVSGNAAITLKPDGEKVDEKLTVTRGSGVTNLFTLKSGTTGTPELAFDAVTVAAAGAGGSLFVVEQGTLHLDGEITLQTDETDTVLVTATGGTVLVDAPILKAATGAAVNFELGETGGGAAQLQLTRGDLGPVVCTGDATIYIPAGFDEKNTSVQMVGVFVAGDPLDFVEVAGASGEGVDLLKAKAAPCFTGKTSQGKPLVGGVEDRQGVLTIVWQAIKVRMAVSGTSGTDEDFTKNYTNLSAAFDDLMALEGPATAVITVLENITSDPQAIPSGVTLTIQADGTEKTITRAAAGDKALFSFKGGDTLTLQEGLVLDGGSPAISAAGGALVEVGADATLVLMGTLQNSKGTNGGAISIQAGGRANLEGTAEVKNNTAANGGGIYNAGGALTMAVGSAVTGNTAGSGGGVYQTGTSATFAMSGGTITGNKAGAAPGETTADGSGVHLADGTLSLTGAPVIGESVLDNNLLNASDEGAAAVILETGYSGAALVQVGGTAVNQAPVATMNGGDPADAPGKAATFRDVGAGRFVGSVGANSTVVWGEPTLYPVHSWDSGGTAFTCDGLLAHDPFADNLLYLMVDGQLLTRGTDYTAVALADGTRLALNAGWTVANAPEDATTGYIVLVMYRDGYGQGAANSIGLSVNGGGEERFTTLDLAMKKVEENDTAVITLYSSTAITGEGDNEPLTITGGRSVTLRSAQAEGAAPYSVLRGATLAGALFTVEDGSSTASLTLENVTLDGCKASSDAQAGGLALVKTGGTLTLGDGATLQNNDSTADGGGICVDGGSAAIGAGATLTGNTTTGNGGGLYLADGTVVFGGGTVTGNTAVLGGGLFAADGTVTGLGGTVGGNTGTGEAIWLSGTATFTVTDGVYDGVVVSSGTSAAASDGTLPAPPRITLTADFDSGSGTILLEGRADGNTTSAMLEGDLVALYDTSFPPGAKAAAARCITSGTGLRGTVQSGGAGVVLEEADSVKVEVPGRLYTDFFGSIEDALAEVREDETATLTVMKSVTMQSVITVDKNRTVTLTTDADKNLTALRGSTLGGNLFTVTADSSLTIKGSGTGTLTIDGNSDGLDPSVESGSLICLTGGTLTIADGAALKNNTAAANGGAVYATDGTLTMTGGTLTGNAAANGGGIYTGVAFTLSGGSVTDNALTDTSGKGTGVYLAQPAGLVMTGGKIGSGTAADDLFQETAAGGLPALTVAQALTSNNWVNLAEWKAGTVKAYADNDLAVLLGGGITYADKLSTAPQLHPAGAAAGLHPVLDPTADGVLLRQAITYTEPLYLEKATGLGSNVNWTLTDDTAIVTGVAVADTALDAASFDASTRGAVSLKRDYLETLENGTYTVVLTVNGTETITTGFTVAGEVVVLLQVDGAADRGFRTLAGALAAAPDGPAAIKLLKDLAVPEPLVVGAARDLTIYSDTPAATLTRGTAGDLFTVEAGASLALRDVTLDGNPAGYVDAGGALVRVDGGSLTLLENATLQNNHNSAGPGAVSLEDGSFTMADGAITGNTSGTGGGGVGVSGGDFVQNGGAISNNTSGTSGGGVAVSGGTATLNGGTIEDNTAANGGGLSVSGGEVALAGSVIEGNTAAQSGGGIHASGGSIEATTGSVTGNTATDGNGGGINLTGSASLTLGGDFAVNGNEAPDGLGGGICMDGTAALTLTGGQVGNPTAGPFDNGIAFHVDNPPVAASGFGASAGHNLNIESLYNDSGPVDFGDDAIPVALPRNSDADYGELVTIAGAIQYQVALDPLDPAQTTHTYNAVAAPDAGGNFTITTVYDLFDSFALYRRVESDPLVYWHFAAEHGLPDLSDLVAVHVGDIPLARGTDFVAERGSIRVTLQESYLKTLKPGVYTAKMYLTGDDTTDPNGYSYLFRFVVQKRPGGGTNPNTPAAEGYDGVYDTKGSPQTGDGAAPGLWLGTALAGLLSLLGGLLLRLRRNKGDPAPEPAPPV